jgi:hypothetical protein
LKREIDHYQTKEKNRKRKNRKQTICFVSEETPGLISGSAILVAQAKDAWYGGLWQSSVI